VTASKLGIYGGTFDPIHNGHLRVITELINRKVVDSIILIPAGEPQLREAPLASTSDRYEMCKLAVNDLPSVVKEKVSVSDIEIRRRGATYAIDTVEELEKIYKEAEIFWIIGSDAYANIDKWHRSAELQDKLSFIVIDRPGGSGDGLDISAIDISATEIRADKEVHGVSPSVRKFITERKLYASK